MFIPGETIIHRFYIPFSPSTIREIVVTYKQNDAIILEKTVTDCVTENTSSPLGHPLNVQLNQGESLLFQDSADYFAQLNVVLNSGHRATSVPIRGHNIPQFHRETMEEVTPGE